MRDRWAKNLQSLVFLEEESNLVSEEQEEELVGISKYEYGCLQCVCINVSARDLREK